MTQLKDETGTLVAAWIFVVMERDTTTLDYMCQVRWSGTFFTAFDCGERNRKFWLPQNTRFWVRPISNIYSNT